MPMTIIPVPCPQCGEAQNVLPENFDPEAEPFGPVRCVACGWDFGRDDYLAGLKKRLAQQGQQESPPS